MATRKPARQMQRPERDVSHAPDGASAPNLTLAKALRETPGRSWIDPSLEDYAIQRLQDEADGHDFSARIAVVRHRETGELVNYVVSTQPEALEVIVASLEGGRPLVGKLLKRPPDEDLAQFIAEHPLASALAGAPLPPAPRALSATANRSRPVGTVEARATAEPADDPMGGASTALGRRILSATTPSAAMPMAPPPLGVTQARGFRDCGDCGHTHCNHCNAVVGSHDAFATKEERSVHRCATT